MPCRNATCACLATRAFSWAKRGGFDIFVSPSPSTLFPHSWSPTGQGFQCRAQCRGRPLSPPTAARPHTCPRAHHHHHGHGHELSVDACHHARAGRRAAGGENHGGGTPPPEAFVEGGVHVSRVNCLAVPPPTYNLAYAHSLAASDHRLLRPRPGEPGLGDGRDDVWHPKHTNLRRWNTHTTTRGTNEQTHKLSGTPNTPMTCGRVQYSTSIA